VRLKSSRPQSNFETGPSRKRARIGPIYGAQESSVPVRNGCIPEAPEGGHSTQPGTLTEGAVVAAPEAPPEAA